MTLAEYLDATTEGPKPHRGMTGTESDWLPLTDFELRGRRLQLLEWAADDDAYQDWSYAFSFDRDETAGVFECAAAGTRVAFAETGFGDGSYPVFYLMRGRERVGLEAECIAPRAPYPFDPL